MISLFTFVKYELDLQTEFVMVILMLLENDFLTDYRVRKEVISLVAEKHRVIVAGITKYQAVFKEDQPECILYRKKIPVFYYKSSVGALKFPFYFNFWHRYIRRILKSEKIDVIHVHDLPLAKVGIEFRDKYKIKMVLDLHENWPGFLEVSQHTQTILGRILSSGKQWRSFEKMCCSQADAVITVVQEMKARIINIGIDPGKVFILENTPLLKKPEKKKNRSPNKIITLIYIGGVTFHRGIQYILEGLTLIRHKSGVELIIAGDGRYLQNLKDLSSTLGLSDDIVKFTGNVTKPAAERLMSESDIALLPHIRSEQTDNSSPNKLYEYMSAGLPIIASDCLSVKRILEETGAGIIYTYNSPKDFAEKVNLLINDNHLMQKMGENGIASYHNKYNWENSSIELKRIYRSLENG
jgi:glycosyltransferase involved in cell wall biosynthesis